MQFIDTHTHLDFTDDIDGWIKRAKDVGVGKIICVGTSIDASRKCAEIAEKFSDEKLQIYSTVGIHAEDGKSDIEKYSSLDRCIEKLSEIAKSSNKVVGVGEAGFDIRLGPVTGDTEKKLQRELFEAQIELAKELKLPLVIHCRNAWEETLALVKSPGVFHSWTGDWESAKQALGLGFYISISGIVTFKNAPNVQAVASKIPLERLLVETDSPFLSPEPMRGSKNEPKNVKIVAEFVAYLRNLPIEEISRVTSENAGRLFEIND